MRQLPSARNIGNQINSKSNFVFIHLSIICEKHSPYYIFPLLETSLLKVGLPQKEPTTSVKELCCKVLLKQKKLINNSSKRLPNKSFHYVSLEHIPLICTKLHYQNQHDLLHTEDLFWRIYWDKEKTKIKEEKYDYCKGN